MIRIFLLFACVMLFASFVIPSPVEGRWISCEQMRIGDDRIVMKKWNHPPCPGADYSYTSMTFDTIAGGRLEICSGSVNFLAGAASCHYAKWTYDNTNSVLTIKDDPLVVEYLVVMSDSTLILTRKATPSIAK